MASFDDPPEEEDDENEDEVDTEEDEAKDEHETEKMLGRAECVQVTGLETGDAMEECEAKHAGEETVCDATEPC